MPHLQHRCWLPGLRRRQTLLLSLCAFAAIGAAGAKAEPVADFYKGRAVTVVVSSSAAGGYDTLARALARYVGKHLPGNPAFIVRNMPGAGGMTATNFLYNNADKDGSVIGLVQNNTPFEPLFGTKEARYDPVKFNWLGSPSSETAMVLLWHTVPVSTLAELKAREVAVGVSGVNSTPAFFTRLLNALLGTKMKPINGYPGQNDVLLAMERRELDGHPSAFFSSVRSTRPTWLREKTAKAILQYGPEKLAELPDVPFAPDLVTSDEDKLTMQAAFAPLALGRPFLIPPGVPAERVAALRGVRRHHDGHGIPGRGRAHGTGTQRAAHRRTDPRGDGARVPEPARRDRAAATVEHSLTFLSRRHARESGHPVIPGPGERAINRCARHGTFRLRVLIAGEIFSKLATYFPCDSVAVAEVPP